MKIISHILLSMAAFCLLCGTSVQAAQQKEKVLLDTDMVEMFDDGVALVMQGMRYPLRPQRHELFEMERAQFGMGHDAWLGSIGRPEPTSWLEFYKKHYKSEPKFKPLDIHAVNFIIDTIRANPHEVTIAAIGPCTNLAAAIRMAPDIVPLVKRVVYMGGAFFQPGNVTPAAEFNWWIDPEAAQIKTIMTASLPASARAHRLIF